MSASVRMASPRREFPLRNHTLLAPVRWRFEHRFGASVVNPPAHRDLVNAVQRFRGKEYLRDGALSPGQLTADGRHYQRSDDSSWHLLVQNDQGEVISCARYLPLNDARFEATVASKSALASSPEGRAMVKEVVEDSIRLATKRGLQFAEFGGWCVAANARNSGHVLRSVLCMFALGEILGGTIGLSTATMRHSSSSILQRLGAKRAHLAGNQLPAYFEPMFDCEMELLQFDSRYPAERYQTQVMAYRDMMREKMRVVCCQYAPPPSVPSLLHLMGAVGFSPTAAVSNAEALANSQSKT